MSAIGQRGELLGSDVRVEGEEAVRTINQSFSNAAQRWPEEPWKPVMWRLFEAAPISGTFPSLGHPISHTAACGGGKGFLRKMAPAKSSDTPAPQGNAARWRSRLARELRRSEDAHGVFASRTRWLEESAKRRRQR